MELQHKNDNKIWWKSAAARKDVTEALKLYREVIDQKNCTVVNRFLIQFAALNHLIIAYNKARFSNSTDQFGCICTLFEKEIDQAGRKKIVSTIRKIGYDNLKNAFRIVNQDCESELLEEGNLFFFLKKHRLKDYDIQSEADMFKYISYYLNVTIVNYNRINNLGIAECSEALSRKKGEIAKIIIPLVEATFDAIFDFSHNDRLVETFVSEKAY